MNSANRPAWGGGGPVQLEALRAIRRERAQGSLLCTPVTPTDLEKMLPTPLLQARG